MLLKFVFRFTYFDSKGKFVKSLLETWKIQPDASGLPIMRYTVSKLKGLYRSGTIPGGFDERFTGFVLIEHNDSKPRIVHFGG